MDLDTFNWLLTEAGQALLAEAMRGELGAAGQLRAIEHLRRQATPARAAAAYELAVLRRRATTKFANAAAMYFTREALEQASGEQIAAHRAQRFAGYAGVADLCCGVGGDTLALARVAPVAAVDRDPLRLAIAAANARVSGLGDRIAFVEADLEQSPPPPTAAIFFDPARRSGGRRVFALADYQPPVAIVRRWRAHTPAIGVKVAPGVSDDDLAALDAPELEVEFISVDGELKEAALWLGPLATPGRRATLLRTTDDGRRTTDDGRSPPLSPPSSALRPQPSALGPPSSVLNSHSSVQPTPPLCAPLKYLYEPDGAILRARLVATLAAQIGAAQIDREIAYLTAEHAVSTPYARCWPIVEWQPFNLKRLRARLRALDAGAVTVKKRGSPIDTDALARQLSSSGSRPLVVVLTRVADQPAALICEEPLQFHHQDTKTPSF